MTQEKSSILAVLAFFVSMFSAYSSYNVQDKLSEMSPIAVVSYSELGNAIDASTDTEEEAQALRTHLSQQISLLKEAGYVVFDQAGSLVSVPDGVALTPEVLGIGNVES